MSQRGPLKGFSWIEDFYKTRQDNKTTDFYIHKMKAFEGSSIDGRALEGFLSKDILKKFSIERGFTFYTYLVKWHFKNL